MTPIAPKTFAYDCATTGVATITFDRPDKLNSLTFDVYREMADVHTGRVRAHVTSAQALGPAELERVRQSLARRTGKQVIIEAAVDAALIGGVVARVGDLVLDGSIRTQLGSLRDKLLN